MVISGLNVVHIEVKIQTIRKQILMTSYGAYAKIFIYKKTIATFLMKKS